jgi:HlyD family secretion protein
MISAWRCARRGNPVAVALGAATVVALGLAACSRQAEPAGWPGVVEADMVRLAAPAAGRLVDLPVARGQQVQPGTALFRIEAPEDSATLAEAYARVAQQAAQAQDLTTGSRPDELAVVAAQLAQARAALADSEQQLRRERDLAAQGFVSGTRIDTLRAQFDQNAARVRELQAQQRVSNLGGRDEARKAAVAALEAARQEAMQVQARLADQAVKAPAAAVVDDTLYRVGEWVVAGSPVVSLLPPSALKVRFYVPETELSSLKPGDTVEVICDGCPAPIKASVRFIAPQAEFTPPVIYSRDQRSRLVFLVEAYPAEADVARLHVGLPVDVRREARAQ